MKSAVSWEEMDQLRRLLPATSQEKMKQLRKFLESLRDEDNSSASLATSGISPSLGLHVSARVLPWILDSGATD
ncbi:hypothetical protein Q8G81_35000, partial [Klebsiella pneumoniae]